jgi:hypothetical protein
MEPEERSFTALNRDGSESGRFIARTPGAAAKKAARAVFAGRGAPSVATVRIRETTRGASAESRVYAYRVERVRKHRPVKTRHATFAFDIVATPL